MPTLPLYGERDQRAPLAVAQVMHARVPRSRLVVVPRAGHGLTAEAPTAVNTAIRGFLTDQTGTISGGW